MDWASGVMVGIDYETTGKDPETAQIVNCAVVVDRPGHEPIEHEWLAAVEIPAETEQFFDGRYTTERCLAEGLPEREVHEQICTVLREYWTPEQPLVAYNAVYDVTVLDRRNIALGGSWPAGPIGQRGGPVIGPILDPYVIDRTAGKKRKGKRTLDLVTRFYGVKLDAAEAHTAIADVRATLALMRTMASKIPALRQRSLRELYLIQQRWHAAWAEDFQDWLRNAPRRDEETDEEEAARREVVITGHWPIVPRSDVSLSTTDESDEERTAS